MMNSNTFIKPDYAKTIANYIRQHGDRLELVEEGETLAVDAYDLRRNFEDAALTDGMYFPEIVGGFCEEQQIDVRLLAAAF